MSVMKYCPMEIYQRRQVVVDRMLAGNIVAWKGTFTTFLQLKAIMCLNTPQGNQCFLSTMGYMPKPAFAESVMQAFMGVLSQRPFDPAGGALLLANMLWLGEFKERFERQQFLYLDLGGHLSLDVIEKGHLLVLEQDKLYQFGIKLKPVDNSFIHAYANACYDVLHQPCLELWSERLAYGVEIIDD